MKQRAGIIHRYYDPDTGRYLTPDPVPPRLAGFTQPVFAYGLDNPLMNVDPTGEWVSIEASRLLAKEALDTAAATGLPGAHNGKQDAFRHCYWSCRMTEDLGAFNAWAVGTAHEVVDNSDSPAGESAMDANNNYCGRKKGGEPGDCKDKCMGALGNGELQTSPGYDGTDRPYIGPP